MSPSVRANFPCWAMAGHGILTEVFDLIVAHTVEVIIRGIILAHMIDAEQEELAVPSPSFRRAMPTRFEAAFPFAWRAFGWRLRRFRFGAFVTADANAIEVF